MTLIGKSHFVTKNFHFILFSCIYNTLYLTTWSSFSINIDRHRTTTINGILSKLHLVERNLGENCLNNESELRQFESNYQSKAAARTRELENAQGQLDAEWARNREIEAEIQQVIGYTYLITISVD